MINSIIGEAAALEKEKERDTTLAGKLARAMTDRHNEAVAKVSTLSVEFRVEAARNLDGSDE
ncbi:MAG TPA: hypothetical protein VKW70_09815 [Terriglobia bacterium]|nr:hypothetical protein [Terriglobia bacterium]